MQFFHLFSFVVVASYAAALPQPAELSEKYSNNVDATLASGLEARSYQPGSNSYKESATLMSLKRRDDSEGSSEEDTSTIHRAINGDYALYHMEEEAGQKIGGRIGTMVGEYIGLCTYVTGALRRWVDKSVPDILLAIKSGLGEDKYSEVEPGLTKIRRKWDDVSNDEWKAIHNATEDIINRFGSDAESFEKVKNQLSLSCIDSGFFFGR
ncbi:hypothetical protein BASA50_005768 [Batrachochytrium salamandrivorans]|uniref:Protein YAE1 n=1 Tax=Batrachochytrium salamandrivorans TaxID=1357716 RepID=A0ABQ8FBZ1_9FUNG|nr:hypothetical protein BASA50_005768 [Batrachochytrium salamandrivorans]